MPAASSPAANQAEPTAAGAQTELDTLVETTRQAVRSTTVWLARGIDGWFGERPFEDGGKVSDGQLDVSLLKRQGVRFDGDVRLNARFRLPNIDRLGYVFVGRDNERELVTDRPGALSRQDQLQLTQAQERAFFVGLGRALDEVFDVRLGLRGAFKPYAQARMRYRWQPGVDDRVDVRQTVFWTVDDRFGSTSALSAEHGFSSTLAVRVLGAVTLTQALPRFVWASSLGAYQSVGEQRLLSFEALVNGQQGSGVAALDYGVQTRWEQPVLRDALVGGIVVGHFWPRPDAQSERRGAWALGVSLKMRF
jgi:hypothetical protein